MYSTIAISPRPAMIDQRLAVNKLSKRDFIDLMHFTKEELEHILRLGKQIKHSVNPAPSLLHKNIGLLFSVPSTRTRVSFQVGARQLGGHAEYLNAKDLQLTNHESFVDTARVLSRYLDAIVLRMYDMDAYGKGRGILNTIAENASIPVINALDDKGHPCQVMADIMTLKEQFGEAYKSKKVVMTWGYSSRFKSPGVLHSMLAAGSLLGMNVTYAYPPGYELDEEYVNFARQAAAASGGTVQFSNRLEEAAQGADVIYVKSWQSLSMSKEMDAKVRNEIRPDWCLAEKHFEAAHPDAIYMDCLPQIRGEGVTAQVMDGKRSVIYDQAENRLHIQKAIMTDLI
ncbi:MAG: ornithine carbamoyltransferase [Cytophagales bacterium]|nr:ornithine carbamoyltransferase [Cytophagales bacterium]